MGVLGGGGGWCVVGWVGVWGCVVGCAVWCGVLWCGVVWCGVVWQVDWPWPLCGLMRRRTLLSCACAAARLLIQLPAFPLHSMADHLASGGCGVSEGVAATIVQPLLEVLLALHDLSEVHGALNTDTVSGRLGQVA